MESGETGFPDSILLTSNPAAPSAKSEVSNLPYNPLIILFFDNFNPN